MVECEFVFLVNIMHLLTRFNRYMVECECCNSDSGYQIFIVLIDTWWNVNLFLIEFYLTHAQF